MGFITRERTALQSTHPRQNAKLISLHYLRCLNLQHTTANLRTQPYTLPTTVERTSVRYLPLHLFHVAHSGLKSALQNNTPENQRVSQLIPQFSYLHHEMTT